MSRSPAEAPAEVHYPESDGQPLGETGIHVNATFDIFGTLKLYFRDRPDVYFTADMFFYYEQGNPRAVKAPDVMVIKGVTSRAERRTYKLWIEQKVPSVIFEVTSEETKRDDFVLKRDLYAKLGVPEYFLFDPLGEYLDPPLRGYRLDGELYVPIVPDARGMLESRELGLKIREFEDTVRFFEANTNQPIPNYTDFPEETRILRANLAAGRKQIDLEKKKAQRESRKAKAERQKAEAERQNAEAERQKAEALEAEVARLRALLGERGIEP
jgi:Uma2 family endonuclease